MPAFEYEALDAKGKKSRGLITADSEVSARRELRGRSMAPLSIRHADQRAERRAKSAGETPVYVSVGRSSLSNRELMLTTRQMASLIGAGMPIAETLGLIAHQGSKHHAKRILTAVRARVTEGEKLSVAMEGFPKSFPPVYCAMVAAGENSGGLGEVLERLADYLEKDEAVRSRVTGAMIYPAILTFVALGVIALLMTFIVPRIAEQFVGMGMDLPDLTRAMIAISAFMQVGWPFLLTGVVALLVIGTLALQREPVRRSLDGLLARLPGLGGFLKHAESARFCRTMGILIESGSVLPDALRSARRAAGNLAFRDELGKVIQDVESGRGLSDSMRNRGWFPALSLFMIAAGERSGALGEMFRRSADQLDQDVDRTISVGLNLLEPGIILVLGVVVVTIVLSILLPILQLNTMALG